MIGYLSGEITIVDPTLILVDVGGIGYEVKISLNTYSKLKDSKKGKLGGLSWTPTRAPRRRCFYSIDEKSLFVKLISISGVGPSTAILMLSSMGVDEKGISAIPAEKRVVKPPRAAPVLVVWTCARGNDADSYFLIKSTMKVDIAF